MSFAAADPIVEYILKSGSRIYSIFRFSAFAVIHMAASTNPAASWEQVLKSYIVGTHNVFEASRQAGVERVILASSVQVSFGYLLVEPYRSIIEERLADVPEPIPPVTHDMPTWPVNDYSAA